MILGGSQRNKSSERRKSVGADERQLVMVRLFA